jgi:uncharacterized protein DUF3572
MHASQAETLALKGLAFLASDGETLLRLLTLTGLELDDLRTRAAEPELLAAVMDFLLSDDALLTRFSEDEDLDVKEIHAARRALPGAPEI